MPPHPSLRGLPSFGVGSSGSTPFAPAVGASAISESRVAANAGGSSRRKLGYTLLAWVGSFTVAFGTSYGAYEPSTR